MSIQNDIDALSCTGREYNSPLDFVPIVNVALVLSGVRGAARLETTDAAFFQAMRELMQRRYPHLKLVHWNAYNAEPVLMDASDPQNVKDMDQIVHALRDGGSVKACEPIVTDPTGRMLGYPCPYRDSETGSEWDSGGCISLCAEFADGSSTMGVAGFGCSKMDLGADPETALERIVAKMRQRWLEPANAALKGVRFLPASNPASADRVISHFFLEVVKPPGPNRPCEETVVVT